MRIDQLHLLRYGRFTNVTMNLPARPIDLHIILGPNEAGKSTTLSAIESLLFGIPHNSAYGFLHNYSTLRIGATLRQGNQSLEVWRRKGNKNTLLGADDNPVAGGEALLMPFLGSVDQTFFSRMFCLDHQRLRQGGQEILDARDEVGQILFSAGSGLTGLRDKLAALDHEADSLWGPRKAGHRKYYQVLDRLEYADKAIRENRVTASHWALRKKEYDEVQQEYADLTSAQAALVLEQRKLSRIRRVYRFVRELAQIDEQMRALGEVAPLAPDALDQLEKAERALRDAAARIDTLQERLKATQSERSEIQCDEALLLREDEVQQLHQRRIEVSKEQADLVQRRADLENTQANLIRFAEELGWDTSDPEALIARIPSRVTLQQARDALRVRGEKVSTLENARKAHGEAEDRIAELNKAINAISAVDVSRLAAVMQSVRGSGDLTARIHAVEAERTEADEAVQSALLSLNPPVAEIDTLLSTAFPSVESVRHYRDTLRDEASRLEECRRQTFDTIHEAEELQRAIDDLTSAEDVVSSEEIAEARSSRDRKWQQIRLRFIEHVEPERETLGDDSAVDLPAAYEGAVKHTDHLADRRLRNAEATAKLELHVRKLAEQQQRIENLRARETMLVDTLRIRQQEWRQLWSATPLEPLTPELMMGWLAARDLVLQANERRARAERQRASLLQEEQQAITAILNELAAVGAAVAGWSSQPLRVLIEGAAALQSRFEQESEHRNRLEEEIRKSTADAERKQRELSTAEEVWKSWQSEWEALTQVLGLRAQDGTEVVARYVDILDQMREAEANIRQLRHDRIDKMERDIDAFNHDVRRFLVSMDMENPGRDPFDAIRDIERRLDEAKRARELRNTKDQLIANLRMDIEEKQEAVRESSNAIHHLQHLAGAQDIETLRTAIHRSNQFRELAENHSRVTATLAHEGDGLSFEELARECQSIDLDTAAARELALNQELSDLQSRMMQVVERREQTRREFEAIGPDSQVAELASERESAIADMRHVAEQYVRVRTAARLLQWAIDRYRGEKQAPLLTRAGQLFKTLTGGSFVDLRVDFDDDDHAQLAGVRTDGGLVRVGGLSDGTADQLYLALRVAAVEDYLATANPLPFVADDLFINFDDKRAAAGLQVLAELATRTQVLFFTHHQHLAQMARNNFGDSISIVDLQGASNSANAQPLTRTAAAQ